MEEDRNERCAAVVVLADAVALNLEEDKENIDHKLKERNGDFDETNEGSVNHGRVHWMKVKDQPVVPLIEVGHQWVELAPSSCNSVVDDDGSNCLED